MTGTDVGKPKGILKRLLSTAFVFSLKRESRSQLESGAGDGVVGGLRIEWVCKAGLAGWKHAPLVSRSRRGWACFWAVHNSSVLFCIKGVSQSVFSFYPDH